ncbi:MAG: methionine--tRNA ligase [Candidatus Thermoplasmatota archaeon]|nr:methionine--tRNA ligase [Euryarchaeota archaeon]MBU4031236.1 methionine--tRNA ligase [Candidatus Thermoplasmatota archaeon]MBU4071962.1 methionine--tRNA ligase [Candidatus Thermoplasmatota archaeon]MBU4143622.1 methionine--tRNA ligase [Candidatus Thermoplasmatota archaeon]MBU4591282.1 methionine--tRNA ligase [Candidatus Thermoplasmatota archaeon]
MAKIFIGVAWPYANGPIHAGHMAGCNLPPDIFRKFHIMRGNEVLMVSGSDMHGTPVTVKAEKEGMEPGELAQKYHLMNVKAFKDFGVEFDEYHSTDDATHIETVQKLFLRLHENGFLYEKEMELPYCSKCDRTLPDRYVEGECPFCHFQNARGDQCEECGKLMDPDMLIGLRCITCGTTPEFVKRTHFFFKLSAQEEPLKKWMSDKDYWRTHVLNFSRMYLENGLKDRPVTRDTTYGIKIPLPGHDDKRIYVWFEAFMGYYTMAVKWAAGDQKKLDSFWKNPECRHYYFLGKDNVPFHTIFWPAVIKSLDWGLNLPYDVPANAFLKFGGQQFSKSRGVSVDIKDIVAKYDPDAMRYYMSTTMPESRDTDFTWEDFITRNNSELVATYGNFVHRGLSFTRKNFGRIPEPKSPGNEEKEVEARIAQANHDAAEYLEKCEFKNGIKVLMELARFGNQYIDTKAPWSQIKQDRDACGTTLYYSLWISRALAVMMAPYLPFSSQKLWESLGEDGKVLAASWEDALKQPKVGFELSEPVPLFKRLDTLEPVKVTEPAKEENNMISSGLDKLDLRVAEVKTAGDHPNADKLLVLTVDVGDGVRQLCAGLKKHYTVEEFIGKKIIVMCNLLPAKLRGIMSEGMLLAASEGEVVSLLAPPQDAKPGDRIDGTSAAPQMTINDFATFQLQIGQDRNAEYVSPDGQHHPFKVSGTSVGTDKNVGPGSKIK